MSESEPCYFCKTTIREGDLIGGWVSFYYRSFPYCMKCAEAEGVTR